MRICCPDYYQDFACRAGGCRHSCCKGWEIDIDAESLSRFQQVKGTLGSDLRAAISLEDTPHFVLDKEERCPFLQKDGLCRLIVELGEDSLCDICAEHPRFYNTYPHALDIGLGACCEEAAHLIVSGAEATAYLLSESEDTEDSADTGSAASSEEWLAVREQVFDLLAGEGSLTARMERSLALLGSGLPCFDLRKEAAFLLTLERMDGDWTHILNDLRERGDTPPEDMLSEMRFQRIAEYFVYRHFAVAEDLHQAVLRLRFAFLSTLLICGAGGVTEDVLRLYSAEIEYSDENVAQILAHLEEEMGESR